MAAIDMTGEVALDLSAGAGVGGAGGGGAGSDQDVCRLTVLHPLALVGAVTLPCGGIAASLTRVTLTSRVRATVLG